MTHHRQNHKRRPPASLLVFILLFSGALLGSCSSMGLNGRLQRSPEVTEAFKAHKPLPNYRYYHIGWENNPYAIIAVDRSYTLAGRLWTEFTPDSQELRKLTSALYNNYDYYPYGAYILDPAGKRVGVWYSAIQWANVRVNDETRTVEILPDTPYLRDEKRTIGRL